MVTVNRADTPIWTGDVLRPCRECGLPFRVRVGGKGRPVELCSPECRKAAHNASAKRSRVAR